MKQAMLFAAATLFTIQVSAGNHDSGDLYYAESCYKLIRGGEVVDETCWKNTEGTSAEVAYYTKYKTMEHFYGCRADDNEPGIVNATSAAIMELNGRQ